MRSNRVGPARFLARWAFAGTLAVLGLLASIGGASASPDIVLLTPPSEFMQTDHDPCPLASLLPVAVGGTAGPAIGDPNPADDQIRTAPPHGDGTDGVVILCNPSASNSGRS